MTSRASDDRPTPYFFGAAGWLFADLLLALAVVFLVANSVGQPPLPPTSATPTPTFTPTPSPTPSPTPIPTPTPLPQGLDRNYITVNVRVDYNLLATGDPGTIGAIQQQLLSDPRLAGKSAGLVITLGGSSGGTNENGLDSATRVDDALAASAAQSSLFQDTVYRPFFNTGASLGQIEVDVYVFK